jgi:hypothetical protein
VSAGPDQAVELDHLVGVLEQARYRERFELGEDDRSRCSATVRTWITVLADATPPRRARLAKFLPRSVLRSWREVEADAPGPTQADPNSLTEVG